MEQKCANCGGKLGLIRYNPKSQWQMQGQLCRKCFDSKNVYVESQTMKKIGKASKYGIIIGLVVAVIGIVGSAILYLT